MERELLRGFPVVIEQVVQWGEQDAFSHVNNIVYFRYFENARIAYLERLGWSQQRAATGIGTILASVQARFRRPVTYPDTVLIGARVTELSDDRFAMEHNIVSRARGELVTEGTSLLVCYLYTEKRKTLIPDEYRTAIEAIEKGNGERGA